MGLYSQVQGWVKECYGFVPQSCWIANVKEQQGLPVRRAPNRQGPERAKLCPSEKAPAIVAALRYYGLIP
jgi:hypothetical protein